MICKLYTYRESLHGGTMMEFSKKVKFFSYIVGIMHYFVDQSTLFNIIINKNNSKTLYEGCHFNSFNFNLYLHLRGR